ncbi:MAG: WGR domain-containing protein, partial [Acidobacteria bacterium]|nr:WGR domain-containing protein [Acidobacteriota bacterium]
MKLIKRTTLHFSEGTSDKVYEVDLCEVGVGAYVVNFRYGRRGAQLKEGSKTVSAVAQAEAEKIAAALLAEKTKKGYREVSADAINAAPIPVRALQPKADGDARAQAVLQHLQKPNGEWKIERVIWRAGELKLQAAAPLIVRYIGSGDALRDYCCAWALGWCGDASAVSALGLLTNDAARPAHVRAIALEAVRKLSPAASSASVAAEWIKDLPVSLQALAVNGPAERFSQFFFEYIAGGEAQRMALTETLYLIDNEHVRPALLHFARTAPLRPNTFKQLRHLLKAAEYRRDAEVFGLLAYRFEKERAMYRNWHENPRAKEAIQYGEFVSGPKSEQTKPDTKFAYSDRTRRYLRQRVWRTLRRLGELQDGDYVKMAVGVLLPFTDADAQETRQATHYELDRTTWRSIATETVHWDRFAGYVAFNHVLYQNSPRYQLKPNTIAWRCRKNYKPGNPEPPVREEAFPRAWEAHPAGLLHLLAESACEPVHHFAVKALRACTDFCQQLDTAAVVMLLGRPYAVTAKLGFELALKRYQAEAPDLNLVLAVADCCDAEARATAHRWIAEG